MVTHSQSIPLEALTFHFFFFKLALWWRTINELQLLVLQQPKNFKLCGQTLWHVGNLPSKVMVTLHLVLGC